MIVPVVAAVVVREGEVLACRRTRDGKWEFPGGKVEAGEDPRDALVREIAEELGVRIGVGDLVDCSRTPVGELVIELSCYLVSLLGEPPTRSTDHDRLRWVSYADLSSLDWAEPDLPAVRALAAGRES